MTLTNQLSERYCFINICGDQQEITLHILKRLSKLITTTRLQGYDRRLNKQDGHVV